jgi:hypothetical protein
VLTDLSKTGVTIVRSGGAEVSLPGISLQATTVFGNININEVSGSLAVDHIQAGFGASVKLTADDSILVGKNGSGVYYEGLVAGGSLNLIATHGSIGANGKPLVMDSDQTGFILFGGSAVNNKVDLNAAHSIYVREKIGSLKLDKATAGDDVYIEVTNGSLLDMNKVETRDERTYDQLKGGVWSDLHLTNTTDPGTRASDKIDATLDSFAVAKDQEYQAYWNYRHMQADGGATYDSTFTVGLTASEQDYYQGFYSEQGTGNGLSGAALTTFVNNAITTLVNSRTDQYHTLHAQYGDTASTTRTSITPLSGRSATACWPASKYGPRKSCFIRLAPDCLSRYPIRSPMLKIRISSARTSPS